MYKNAKDTDIEIRRIPLDANLDMPRLNLAVELLGMNIWRQININVNLLQSLIPFKHFLT